MILEKFKIIKNLKLKNLIINNLNKDNKRILMNQLLSTNNPGKIQKNNITMSFILLSLIKNNDKQIKLKIIKF